MARRGVKPKAAHLHLVDGTNNVTRHGSERKLRKAVESAKTGFGPLVKPRSLKGEAASAWKHYIEPAWWLDRSKEAAAVAFCDLWAEFRFAPTSFQAAKHGQMRAYMSELGLTDERNRGPNEEASEKDEFFD